MEVILLDNVIGLGRAGDIKTVKDGYARNYLLPQKLVEVATRAKQNYLKKMQEVLAKKAEKIYAGALELKEQVEALSLEIKVKAGEEGKLFGSVTHADIAALLAEQGFEIEKKKIVSENIKTVGEHLIKIKLDEGVTGEVKLKVFDPNLEEKKKAKKSRKKAFKEKAAAAVAETEKEEAENAEALEENEIENNDSEADLKEEDSVSDEENV